MNPTLILSLISYFVSEVPVAEEEILKIKAMLSQSPSTAAALQALLTDADAVDVDTITRINTWLTSKGFQPITDPTAVQPVPPAAGTEPVPST